MADVYEYVVPQGVIVPDAQTIQTQVQDEYKQAFGQDLIVTPDTPQGVLIVAETLARIAAADNNAAVANQFNPNISGGIFLDALLALMGAQRTPEVHSRVSCDLTGVSGTIIPQGSQARDVTTGYIFQSMEEVTLAPGSPGTATVNFEAVDSGSITVGAGDLSQIVSDVLGWETITNPDVQSVLGVQTQSDQAARLLRQQTLALQGMALPEAILSGLYETTGVLSATLRENIASTTQVIDGVTMVGHSIYVCCDGGSDDDVANVLLAKKSGGCAYNNGASDDPVDVELVVPFSGQTMDILFDRPDIIPILVRATVRADSAIQDPTAAVKNAIVKYASGLLDGEAGLTVGTSVSCFELAGAVNRESPGIYVQNMETSLVSPIDYSNDEIPISIFEKATLSASSITVVLV